MQIDPEGIEVRELFKAADFTNARVLEVGSGDGRLSFRYGDKPASVIGIEPAAKMIATAIATCPAELREHMFFVQGSGTSLPFAARSFDFVLFSKSL